MDSYRLSQAARWREKQPKPPLEGSVELPQATTASLSEAVNTLMVDATSLDSITSFVMKGNPRCGILYGVLEGHMIVVDAIYECAQDTTSGEPLHDTRMPMVQSISGLMGMRPVGILVTSDDLPSASMFVRLARLTGAVAHALLVVNRQGVFNGYRATQSCLDHVAANRLTNETTLTGPTVRGGLHRAPLSTPLDVVKRQINQVVHTGFFRLNRPDHVPTLNDARAFIVARRDKANIGEIHKQLADYHLLLFIADRLGESAAERAILAIFQEEDELVEQLVELLMSASDDVM